MIVPEFSSTKRLHFHKTPTFWLWLTHKCSICWIFCILSDRQINVEVMRLGRRVTFVTFRPSNRVRSCLKRQEMQQKAEMNVPGQLCSRAPPVSANHQTMNEPR